MDKLTYDFKDMAKHYVSVLLPSDSFLSPNPVRDKDLLYEPFHEMLLRLADNFHTAYGYAVKSLETFRSQALQLFYYNNGASQIKTNGMHHYGVACDFIFIDPNGASTYKGPWNKLHDAFEAMGGPDLGSLESWDAGHLQYIPVSEQTTLREYVKIAVKDFQGLHGLTRDGIAGPKTHAKAVELRKEYGLQEA